MEIQIAFQVRDCALVGILRCFESLSRYFLTLVRSSGLPRPIIVTYLLHIIKASFVLSYSKVNNTSRVYSRHFSIKNFQRIHLCAPFPLTFSFWRLLFFTISPLIPFHWFARIFHNSRCNFGYSFSAIRIPFTVFQTFENIIYIYILTIPGSKFVKVFCDFWNRRSEEHQD